MGDVAPEVEVVIELSTAAEEFEAIREGIRTILAAAVEAAAKIAAPWAGTPGVPPPVQTPAKVAAALEREIYAEAGGAPAPSAAVRRAYVAAMRATERDLVAQTGTMPWDVAGAQLVAGTADAASFVKRAAGGTPWMDVKPRAKIQQLFVRALLATPEYAANPLLALKFAHEIESACFNTVVRMSRNSEEPPRRNWTSPAFVEMYSTRCGTVAGLIDVNAAPCRAYGIDIARRLLLPPHAADALTPEDIGSKSERELCPQATAAERDEIARRSEQTVREKESNLFKCPHCYARRCLYRVAQLRSADEAPDYLCYCLNCNRRFKGHG